MNTQRIEYLLRAALLARDVYGQTENTEAMGVRSITDVRPTRSDCGAFGCAYIADDAIHFVVRGSANIRDWGSNLRAFWQTDFYGCSVHRGFAHAARGLERPLMDLVTEHDKPLNLIGHSRGGSVAQLLAITCSAHAVGRAIKVITFGAPKTGRADEIRQAFRGPVIRVVNGSDAVVRRPNLPWYSHHQTKLAYLPNRRKSILIDPGWWTMWRDRALTGGERARDHLIDDYTRELSFHAAITS